MRELTEGQNSGEPDHCVEISVPSWRWSMLCRSQKRELGAKLIYSRKFVV